MNNQKEIFKPIKNYEGFYAVSNLGNVKSIQRTDTMGRIINECILKPASNKGFQQVCLYRNNNKNLVLVQRLVADTFLLDKGEVVYHIDGDRANNRLDNLKFISLREKSSLAAGSKLSLFTGVSYTKFGKYNAAISIKGKRKHLGNFALETEAAAAYQNALNNLNT